MNDNLLYVLSCLLHLSVLSLAIALTIHPQSSTGLWHVVKAQEVFFELSDLSFRKTTQTVGVTREQG